MTTDTARIRMMQREAEAMVTSLADAANASLARGVPIGIVSLTLLRLGFELAEKIPALERGVWIGKLQELLDESGIYDIGTIKQETKQ